MYGMRDIVASEMYGEEGCPFVGDLVGLSSFNVPKSEEPISLEN